MSRPTKLQVHTGHVRPQSDEHDVDVDGKEGDSNDISPRTDHEDDEEVDGDDDDDGEGDDGGGGDGGDGGNDIPLLTALSIPRKLTARRRADNENFKQWMIEQQQKEIDEALNSDLPSSDPFFGRDTFSRRAFDEHDPANQRIIGDPRAYQVELFERAKQKNIIAVLDTGSGKTLIAALLLRHVVAQELQSRGDGEEHRISFFLVGGRSVGRVEAASLTGLQVDKVSLVNQQYKVLKANLDCPVQQFCGDNVGSSGTRSFWEQQLKDNMVIVCTAAILQSCLHHAFFGMAQINLLIFDEAHHAKKNHPYARIIKDFYTDLEDSGGRRPRIFGMTASPVDTKTDFEIAAAQLEALLHSQIATVADGQATRKSIPVGKDLSTDREPVVQYAILPSPFETALWQRLNQLVGKNAHLKRLFTFSLEATKELGRWPADRVWQMCLTHDEAVKIKARTERDLLYGEKKCSMELVDRTTSAVMEAQEVVREHVLPPLQDTADLVSSKVSALIRILQTQFKAANQDRCIIFVQQRLTAIMLQDVIKQSGVGLEHVEAAVLLGSSNGDAAEFSMSTREQVKIIGRFRRGNVNCLIATSIAEEGLDIADCNMIIRFDLYDTLIQYIQSRGRARRADSRYFHMIQFGSSEHAGRVSEIREHEQRLQDFCQALPEDRKLRGNDYDMDYFLSKERALPVMKISATGAKLTYRSSLVVLATFAGTLPHSDTNRQVSFVVKGVGTDFQCEVIMPDVDPVRGMTVMGRRAGSKQVAKCSAGFEMCKKLRAAGLLDANLKSTLAKSLPAMRNAVLALSSKKRAEYPMKVKPEAWGHLGFPDSLFVTVVKLSTPDALGRPSRPLAILTRTSLPELAKFPLFFGNKATSTVEFIPLRDPISVSPSQVQGLDSFTLRVFKDVFSKVYKSEPEKLPYYLAPVKDAHGFGFEGSADAASHIDWECVDMIHRTEELEWDWKDHEFIRNRFVIDPHDGGRKFFTIAYKEGLRPSDEQLAGVPRGSLRRKAKVDCPDDIWDYSTSLWARSRARVERRDDLPVVEAEFIPIRRNLLDEYEKADGSENRCYLTFITFKLSAMPVEVVAMAYNLPAIIHRLESNLIVLETCQALGLAIRPDLALEAMTKDSDNSEEQGEEQVNFQKGMGNNYERLELLGDSFLKLATTIALYTQDSDSDEFIYHVDRMILVCNKNLFNNALELKIEQSIRSTAFNRRVWYPHGLELLKGKQMQSIKGRKELGRQMHVLGDKSIADVCEALIGAAYLTTYAQGDFDLAIQAVTKFTMCDKDGRKHAKVHEMRSWAEYYAAYQVPDWQSAPSSAAQIRLAEQIEERVGYKFTYPRLLRSAFTHPSYSYMYEHIPHYQRLEFLGDALFDMVCVNYLFHRFPGADPQWLTEHKMAMVSNQFLGCLCVSLHLQKHLAFMTGGLPQQIADYVEAITSAREAAEDEAEQAGLSRDCYARSFWVSEKSPPKCLPDTVESLIGAIFVDSKYDYSQVQRFFDSFVRPFFEDMRQYDTFANKHPVTSLTNKMQLEYRCANWRLMVDDLGIVNGESQVVCGFMIHGVVRTYATASSGRYAKIAAAKKIAALLEDVAVDKFKRTYGCTCTAEEVHAVDPTELATAV